MRHRTISGSIEVICGSMFSGKTEELVRRLKRAQIAKFKVQVFKPIYDNRYSDDHVQSHNANRIPSVCVQDPKEILNRLDDNTRVVGIDEAQFFSADIVDVAQKLAYRGIQVIVAGLDMDYLGKPFGPMPALLAVAEDVTKLSAICMVCGGAASRSQRVVRIETDENPHFSNPFAVGGVEQYEARCRFCHEPQVLNPPAPGLSQNPSQELPHEQVSS